MAQSRSSVSSNGNGQQPSENGSNGEWLFKEEEYDPKDSMRQLYRKVITLLHKVGSYFGQINSLIKDFIAFKEAFSEHQEQFEKLKADNKAFRVAVANAINPLLARINSLESNFVQETKFLKDAMIDETNAFNGMAKNLQSYHKALDAHKRSVDDFKKEVSKFTDQVVNEGVPAKLGPLPYNWLISIDDKLAPVEKQQTQLIQALIEQNARLEKRLKVSSIITITILVISFFSILGFGYFSHAKFSIAQATVQAQVEAPRPQPQAQPQPQPAAPPAPAQAETPKKPAHKPVPEYLKRKANKD